jgi:DNA polymerase-1
LLNIYSRFFFQESSSAMKFILIDAMGLVFRAYHAMSKMGLQAPNGELTGAVFGFGNILATILSKEQPDYVCVAFDTAAPTFRHERFEAYKAHRPEFPADLAPQLLRIKELVRLLNLRQIEMPGYEADDIIGTLALRTAAERADVDVYCLTSDKDYCQLVGERVKLLRPGFAMGEYEVMDVAGVEAKFGVKPHQVVDVLALIGDASDNVPGVKGIGEKTGIPLIQQFGSVEGVYENLAQVSKDAVRKKLESDREMAMLSKELVTIHTTVPVDAPLEEFARQKPDTEQLREFFLELGFKSMLGKFIANDAKAAAQASSKQGSLKSSAIAIATQAAQTATHALQRIADVPHEYVLADTPEKINAMIEELRTAPMLAFDCETTGLDTMTCEVIGMSFAGKEGRAFYVPVQSEAAITGSEQMPQPPSATAEQQDLFESPQAFPSQATQAAPSGAVPSPSLYSHSSTIKLLRPLLEDAQIPKCGQNAKFDAVILRRYGVNVAPIAFDAMLASYVLNPSTQHGMDALAQRWLQYAPIPITSLIGENKKTQISMREVAVEQVAEYAAEDADVTLRLTNRLKAELEKEGLTELAERTEFALVEVLTEMEFNGITIDVAALKAFSTLLVVQMNELKGRIFAETARFGVAEFNVDSPKQLGEILFDKMGIPPLKKTQTGYSTDASVLEELAHEHPIAELMLEYRQLAKLQSTYVEALPKLVKPATGRVHTTFNQTVASTGRLSSTDPNLQNIPIRTELGMEIRRAFVPAQGMTLLSADYSQIELRIMAHICGDETLVNAFQHGLDIHAATAATLFGTRVQDVTRDQRRVAKTVNFGVMYGQGAFGLARQLKISRTEGKEIIDNYFAKYPRIKDYIDSTIASTREKGFATTLLGRRCYFPDIASGNRVARTAAERAAINMPIQGTAADMMKLAMVNVHRAMVQRRTTGDFRAKMMLQIHDELVFETPPEELEELTRLVKSQMEGAFPLGVVPVVVEVGTGKNWAEAH